MNSKRNPPDELDRDGAMDLLRKLGAVAWRDVAEALAGGLSLALGGAWQQGEVTPSEGARAQCLESDHYAADAWTWRR